MAEEKKLDSLLERIYQDGVEKSNKKSDEILANARKEAEKIINDANNSACNIVKEAERKAEELRKNTITDVRMSGEQAISTLKQRIKDLIVVNTLGDNLKEAFVDTAFLKSLILEVVKKWDLSSGVENIAIYFPESKKGDIEGTFEKSIKESIKNATINFDKRLSGGFKIVPKGGNYQMQFTDSDFVEFFSDFLKAKTEEILFNK